MVELQKAKERNERLDVEIRVLRDRVRSLDTERKTLIELARINIFHMCIFTVNASVENIQLCTFIISHIWHRLNNPRWTWIKGIMSIQIPLQLLRMRYFIKSKPSPPFFFTATHHFTACNCFVRILMGPWCVGRCRRASEDKDSRLRELERRLQKQQRENEELVERNEELEALLGEAQNAAKAERERHECEMEGLQRNVSLRFVSLWDVTHTWMDSIDWMTAWTLIWDLYLP